MDRLLAMEVFVRVVESGSFSAVAREIGSTQSAVSKQVAALEAYLGAKLISRTTRSLSLTDEGRAYHERAQRIVHDASEARASLLKGKRAVTGRLRIGASNGFGRIVLLPIVQGFMEKYPDIEVDLQLNDRFVDVVAEGLDVAVRVGELQDSSLLAQRIGTAQRCVVASKELAASLGRKRMLPSTPADLEDHDCILYTMLNTPGVWVFDATDQHPAQHVRVRGRFATSSSEVVREAVVSGMGIGYAPTHFFTQELARGDVIRLLSKFSPHPLPVNAVYAQSRQHSSKLSAFIAFAKQAMTDGA
jgi:DNA-binding transcriptional LysR family regulator